jgi:PTH1 family peptidyl-tRNA hydrolase
VKLVVGLGNPGPRYAATRHNIGFRIAERFAQRCGIALAERRFGGRFGRGWLPRSEAEPIEVGVLEPETWMNRSGSAVAEALAGLPVADPATELLVAFDDVDLSFGRLRLRPGGGSGGHLGLLDVTQVLGRSDIPRLRFGVGRPEVALDTREWVLAPFSADEEARLGARLEAAAEAIEIALRHGVRAAMDRFNADPAA